MATSQNVQSCRLLQVPAEILDRITWHLTTHELCNLRSTCKSVEEALYFSFTAEFFTRKQFMVSEFSLKALIDMSKSRLSRHLRHIHIGLDQIESNSTTWRNTNLELVRTYQQRLIDQGTLWTLGLVPKYLAEAFANLPNLESVVVRDFNSSRRSRDGPYSHWLSYGNQTMWRETGARPGHPRCHSWSSSTQQNYAGRLFKAVIHALGMAKANPTTIEMMERNGNYLFDSAFHIHSGSEADIIPVLRGLKRLHLGLDVTEALSLSSQHTQTYHQFHLAKFLRHCDELEELRINGDRKNQHGARVCMHLLFDWLATAVSTPAIEAQKEAVSSSAHQATSGPSLFSQAPSFVEDIPPPPPAKLARLENLSLGMMALTTDEIVRFVAKCAGTLQCLELWRIQVMYDGPGIDESRLENNRGILVAQLLKKLLNIPNLNLRHIKLGHIRQRFLVNSLVPTQDIHFKPTAKATDEEVDSDFSLLALELEYTGTDWRHFVAHEMIPRLYTIKPVVNIPPDEEDEDEEDEDNGDEDADEMDQDEEES